MTMCKRFGLLIILLSVCLRAQQTTDYVTVDIPVGAQPASKVLWVKWTGSSRTGFPAPDSGFIYFDRAPGGGILSNYRYRVNNPYVDTLQLSDRVLLDTIDNKYYMELPPVRATAFKPEEQTNMSSGVFYCIIALPRPGIDTLFSNEFQIIVESPNAVSILAPNGTITSLTPTFQWKANIGIPYYHIILSDDAIKIDTADGGSVDLQGMSIIWQAITPNTQIVYGAPDPSRTLTADPPPLSPGQNYTWLVLNNYGNHPALSSTRVGAPGEFKINGTQMEKPLSLYPAGDSLNSERDSVIQFRWTNLDKAANTYKIYVYVGSDFEGINAQMIVWQTEIMAPDSADTLSLSINAASILTSNKYTWRAIAVDSKGAGTIGDTVGFWYEVPTGELTIQTREQIVIGNDTAVSAVGLAEIKVEVLDGSLEAPLLYYTDMSGNLTRSRPTGTYRITALKSEFERQTQTVVLSKDQSDTVVFFLERPEATVFGKVLDESNKGINLASVSAVSDRGDTVSVKTNAQGNYVLNCYAADWYISSEKNGYQPVIPKKITVESGENFSAGTITLKKNPYTLSGVVKNSSGTTLLGVRVRVMHNGVLIDEVPSTPQNGTFSFSLPAGSYTITALKNGFTSYRGTVDMLSSKTISITMHPGATIISGYVYGRSWVKEREVVAPITNATIAFVQLGSNDTFTTMSDFTYGEFSVSLPGDKEFVVISSANGYISYGQPCTLKTIVKSTQNFNDTLQALGMFSGTVRMSSTNNPVGNVMISLIGVSNGEIVSTGKSSSSGYFEVRNISDGAFLIRAGKYGYVLDSISGPDTLYVVKGKVNPATVPVYLKPGDKTVKGHIVSSDDFAGKVKVQSPVIKSLPFWDSLTGSGPGVYVISVDAVADSFLDLAYHRFSIGDSELVHIDTVSMQVMHSRKDTLWPVHGTVTVELKSENDLDSAVLYFKEARAGTFTTVHDSSKKRSYTFTFTPPRDGSIMQYYFRAYSGSDIYGYSKELYNVFIAPDTSRLTRVEIVPSSDDTLLYPSNYNAQFSLKGYYSSVFLLDTTIDPNSITWRLKNPQGCSLEKTTGLSTTLKTGNTRVFATPVILIAIVDTTVTRVTGSICSVSIPIRVSGSALKHIKVTRIDAGNPDPITTSASERAEFAAEGYDVNGNVLAISPKWSVSPSVSGTISSDGVFRPSRKFAGTVRVFADVASMRGEYYPEGQEQPGLDVQFMITCKESADTAMNGLGCSVIFPEHAVKDGDIGILSMIVERLENQIERGDSKIKTVGTVAFTITETQNTAFQFDYDSIRLELDIPSDLQRQAASGNRKIKVAWWNRDSLKWMPLPNSVVSKDGKIVSANLSHFSRYAIVVEAANSGYLNVAPNPFSPMVWPRNLSDVPRYGTCIEFQLETVAPPLHDVRVRIFNVAGDLVWSLSIPNANQQVYRVWWDGRTSRGEMIAQISGDNNIEQRGEKMCRNGRYFVVVTARDSHNREQRYMKHIVLMK